MKKILSILAVIGLLITIQGCTDWLDIRPESEIVLDDFWKNESHVMQVVASCYKAFTEESAMERMLGWGEIRSDNVTYGVDVLEHMYRIMNFDITTNNFYSEWGSMYRIINYCNTFLHYAPDVVGLDQNFTEPKLRALTSEVLTLRALAYFYLVRTFKEVPWIDSPSLDDTQNYAVPKSSEDVILDKLEKDLEYALTYGRDVFETNTHSKGRITRNAIRALLADIYLWRNKYTDCINMANQVLADPTLVLVDGESVLRDVFYIGNSSESIFELQFNTDTNPNEVVRRNYGFTGRIRGRWTFPLVLVIGNDSPFSYRVGATLSESEEDIRAKDFIRSDFGGDVYWVFKYVGIRFENAAGISSYGFRSNTANWIVYRLSDVMLMKAEALVQLGGNAQLEEAIEMVNTTYLRSNFELESDSLTLQNYGSVQELERLVLRERQRELMFEGKRWFDLMRLARRAGEPSAALFYVTRKFTGGSFDNSRVPVLDALYLPIHVNELKNNPALKQNPFYELTSGSSSAN